MNTQITETALSNRAVNALRRNGLFTVGGVINYHKEHGIAKLDGVGKSAIQEINNLILAPNDCGIAPKRPRVKREPLQPKERPQRKPMGRRKPSQAELLRFKQYFDELHGQGLEVANWHENGALESFDNFYESAIEYSLRKENNK